MNVALPQEEADNSPFSEEAQVETIASTSKASSDGFTLIEAKKRKRGNVSSITEEKLVKTKANSYAVLNKVQK